MEKTERQRSSPQAAPRESTSMENKGEPKDSYTTREPTTITREPTTITREPTTITREPTTITRDSYTTREPHTKEPPHSARMLPSLCEPNSYDWQQTERPRKIMFASDDIPFAWKNPLNTKSKRYSSIRKALKEINKPK